MRDKNLATVIWIALSLAIIQLSCGSAWAYPGGPLRDVTDIAPYCAGCHSSVGIEQLRDLPPAQAQKRTVAGHIDAIKSGEGPYAKLSAEQRTQLIADVEKVDANSKIAIDVPATVKPGEKFSVTVKAQGGSGPVVGIALLDVDLRDQAREVQGEGFLVDSAPQVTGPDGKSQDQWLSRRYDALAHNLNFIVIFGVKADLAADKFSTASVKYELVAPSRPGQYTICAALFYGTEKASPIGRVEQGGRVMPLGGFDASSGRILFTKTQSIEVK